MVVSGFTSNRQGSGGEALHAPFPRIIAKGVYTVIVHFDGPIFTFVSPAGIILGVAQFADRRNTHLGSTRIPRVRRVTLPFWMR